MFKGNRDFGYRDSFIIRCKVQVVDDVDDTGNRQDVENQQPSDSILTDIVETIEESMTPILEQDSGETTIVSEGETVENENMEAVEPTLESNQGEQPEQAQDLLQSPELENLDILNLDQADMDNTASVVGLAPTDGKPALDYAQAYLSQIKYVLGGRYPTGYNGPYNLNPSNEPALDCVGLVMAAANASIGLNYSNDTILNTNVQRFYNVQCKAISKSQLLPGDLVFYRGTYDNGNGPNELTHVGFYAGNNMIYHTNTAGSYPYLAGIDSPKGPAFQAYGRIMVDSSMATRHTVTFEDVTTGSILKRQTVLHGGNATPPTIRNEAGKTFLRWNGSYTNVSSSRTVYAMYNVAPTYYTVTFKDTLNNKVLSTQRVKKFENATPPTVSDTANYHFAGWYGGYNNVTSNRTVSTRWQKRIDISTIVKQSTIKSFRYTGKPITPSVSSLYSYSSNNYTLLYRNNTNVGTASVIVTGKGRLKGSKTLMFKITPKIIYFDNFFIAHKHYTGRPINVTVNKEGVKTTCSNNVNVGKASATISTISNNYILKRGKFTYKKLTLNFDIVPRSISGSTTWGAYRFKGKTIHPKPSPTWSIDGHRMIERIDYFLTYTNTLNSTTAYCYIHGKGNYRGTLKCKFTIIR